MKDEIAELRKSIKDSNASLEALSGALMQFVIHGEEGRQELEDALNRYRRLGKYNRRTHFYTMAYMVFLALFLADIAQHAHSGWWGLLFWATQHGNGGSWETAARIVGFVWQVGYVAFLVKIAQVPDDLWEDVTAAQIKREKQAKRKRFRVS